MEPTAGKPSFLRNILVRLFLFCVLVLGVRFAYVVTLRGESCDLGDFCFFSVPENINTIFTGAGYLISGSSSSSAIIAVGKSSPSMPSNLPEIWSTKDFRKAAQFYTSVFQDLISEGFLSPEFKALCVDTPTGADVFALKEIGVLDSIGIFKKSTNPLIIPGQGIKQPFGDANFDFVFSGYGMVEKSLKPLDFASEICRTLKPEGFLVVHTGSQDEYSFNSLLHLFNCCTLIKTRNIHGFDSNLPLIREVVLKRLASTKDTVEKLGGESTTKCSVPGYKQELIRKAEPLILEEPKKPWLTLKKNMQNVKYLPSVADISFKQRYIYVDVGARSYGSSIVSWFKKQYPKQNKTFEIFAIEADKHFHEQYEHKKGVTLLPYAAWVKNESLFFEINHDPVDKDIAKGRGMGRIKPVQSSANVPDVHVDEIQGFDFAEWLKRTVSVNDFVVMKMDVEGTEFDLIPRLIKTGAICLIDEIFLECHYNRWQKCCPGERSKKYEKTYDQCMDLFASLRQRGVLVHQWW